MAETIIIAGEDLRRGDKIKIASDGKAYARARIGLYCPVCQKESTMPRSAWLHELELTNLIGSELVCVGCFRLGRFVPLEASEMERTT